MHFQNLSKGIWADLQDGKNWSPTSYFPMNPVAEKAQLCTGGATYLNRISSMAQKSRPDLGFLRDELERQAKTMNFRSSRAALLKFPTATNMPPEFISPTGLKVCLSQTSTNTSRLFVLEDITPAYVDAFGLDFDLDPSFFAQHLRNTNWENSIHASDASSLPSTKKSLTYCLWYPELLVFPSKTLGTDKLETTYFCFSNLYRQITLIGGRSYGADFRVGTIMRKVSVCIRMSDAGVWEGLILVDPPIGEHVYSQQGSHNPMKVMSTKGIALYKGGYIDLLASSTNQKPEENITSPERLSMLDDLLHYTNGLASLDTTLMSTVSLTNKIPASMWANMLELLKENISKVEWIQEKMNAGSSAGSLQGHAPLHTIQVTLEEIGHWRRRCAVYHEWMLSNVAELTSFFDQVQSREAKQGQPKSTFKESVEGRDWHFLQNALEGWKTRTADGHSTSFALLSLVESQKSLDEAESSRLLATLGVLYLPFSLAAGILSMSTDFAAGSERFWIFFAVAFPLLAVSLVLAGLLRWQHSISTMWQKSKGRQARRKSGKTSSGKGRVEV